MIYYLLHFASRFILLQGFLVDDLAEVSINNEDEIKSYDQNAQRFAEEINFSMQVCMLCKREKTKFCVPRHFLGHLYAFRLTLKITVDDARDRNVNLFLRLKIIEFMEKVGTQKKL